MTLLPLALALALALGPLAAAGAEGSLAAVGAEGPGTIHEREDTILRRTGPQGLPFGQQQEHKTGQTTSPQAQREKWRILPQFTPGIVQQLLPGVAQQKRTTSVQDNPGAGSRATLFPTPFPHRTLLPVTPSRRQHYTQKRQYTQKRHSLQGQVTTGKRATVGEVPGVAARRGVAVSKGSVSSRKSILGTKGVLAFKSQATPTSPVTGGGRGGAVRRLAVNRKTHRSAGAAAPTRTRVIPSPGAPNLQPDSEIFPICKQGGKGPWGPVLVEGRAIRYRALLWRPCCGDLSYLQARRQWPVGPSPCQEKGDGSLVARRVRRALAAR